ncbi:ipa protein [Colletotrichum musicola]|uniref:Ipa protein n=1 Tax=Colletotrichum musicola TaxID=2175873 RepID=A0A8H6MS89_9PEZI|nr:ipa protein [Colletotrichum musicola]
MTDQKQVQKLHKSLCKKVQSKGPRIWSLWKSLNQEQRTAYVLAAGRDGPVLQHPVDPSMRAASACVPEWNLRDLTSPGREEHLMELLRYRGLTDLIDQYRCAMYEHLADGLGDHEYVKDAMASRGLRYDVVDRDTQASGYYCFVDSDMYGMYISPTSGMVSGLQMFIGTGNAVPRDVGKLVLTRQMYFFERLNNIVDDLLAGRPQQRTGSAAGDRVLRGRQQTTIGGPAASNNLVLRGRPQETAAAAAAAAPAPVEAPVELDPLLLALDRKSSLDAHLAVLSSNPTLLAYEVESWFSSRPELVADERGRSLRKDVDKQTNGAVLDTLHNAVRGAAAWAYLTTLLERAESKDTDGVHKSILLQEISNVAHHELARAQAALRRHVSKESRWFKRVSNAYDAVGNARITAKGKIEELEHSDPQLYCMLRLCHQDTTAAKAGDWLKKLADLHRARPVEREKLSEAELGALAELSAVLGFIQDLSRKISLPPLSRKKCQLFVSGSQELEKEMNELKRQLDLGEYAVPVSKLSEPGMAEGALNALDEFVVEKAGTKLGFLYQDLIEDCFSYLQKQYDENKTKTGKEWTPLPLPAREPREKLVEQRAERHAARASPVSDYEITPRPKDSGDAVSPAGLEAFKASPTTAKLFESLLGQTDPVSWTAFKDAMAELKFSVVSKDGFVFTFVAPESMGAAAKKPIAVSRPYKDQMAGPAALILAQRLRRSFLQ